MKFNSKDGSCCNRCTPKLQWLGACLVGGPVVRTSPSNAGDVGSPPGLRAKIPHVSEPKKPKHKVEAIL